MDLACARYKEAEGRPSGTEHGTKGAGGGGAKRCGTLGGGERSREAEHHR
jgi:hypothetical protein